MLWIKTDEPSIVSQIGARWKKAMDVPNRLKYQVHRGTGKVISVDAGSWVVTVFNQYEDKPFEEYDINYKYYLQRITREIESARGSQLTLLF